MYQNIVEILEKYDQVFPEDIDLPKFLEYLNNPENQGEKCVDRKNMNGHLDTDALVVHDGKALMIYHKSLQRWLQPGGHIETGDKSFVESAIREVKEETGLDVVPVEGVFSAIPFSLDVQIVPKNEKKNEDEHIHYSLMFLLKLKNENQEIVNNDDGVEEVKWFPLGEAVKEDKGTALPKAVGKYKKLF
jgi:8-oxo-dGTP pyrophosphatase MutT (NUDIX family)